MNDGRRRRIHFEMFGRPMEDLRQAGFAIVIQHFPNECSVCDVAGLSVRITHSEAIYEDEFIAIGVKYERLVSVYEHDIQSTSFRMSSHT